MFINYEPTRKSFVRLLANACDRIFKSAWLGSWKTRNGNAEVKLSPRVFEFTAALSPGFKFARGWSSCRVGVLYKRTSKVLSSQKREFLSFPCGPGQHSPTVAFLIKPQPVPMCFMQTTYINECFGCLKWQKPGRGCWMSRGTLATRPLWWSPTYTD